MSTAGSDASSGIMPKQPIDRITRPVQRFMHIEAASGIVLVACTAAALILANSAMAESFLGFWKTRIGFQIGDFTMFHSLQHWINDGLMALFFFVVGLEVKREIVIGELRGIRKAALPVAAAIGGMVVPAGVYLLFQGGGSAGSGWGIPMATDIAFVVGCMAVLGPRVPHGLRILLLSLAIVDDIGAILVIAIGYSSGLNLTALALGAGGLALIWLLNRAGVRRFPVYAAIGFLVWLAVHESGIHATIAGVILGLMTPASGKVSEGRFRTLLERSRAVFEGEGWQSEADRPAKLREFKLAARETISPVEYLESALHPWVGFVIMPVFALANAGVPFHLSDLGNPIALAIVGGLVVGKLVGITFASWGAVRLGLAQLPEGVGWGALIGGACLAGIGFTMALFIAGLALEGDDLDVAKVGILAASVAAATLGMAILLWKLPKTPPPDDA